ncbi:Phthiocerol synthesis polyketide synthase type I PpsE [Nymphon striatum]|nr:Phthiocerol synthesis polyketide synthase type I PpsE [Nymphon striatum]
MILCMWQLEAIVPSAKTFDAGFFGLNPKLAEAMDPQQRLFLEIAWEALEQTGHLPKHYKGSIGVYAGTGTNTYYKNNVLPNEELIGQVGHLQANTVNEKDYISSRTAYHLNLKGPAVSVQSACSTSLLAIAEAVEAIRNGQCDIALAGGSSITAPMYTGHLYQEGSILSEDGHCRTFDAKATGTVFSDGAGVVLLKSLKAAKEDGDHIYGLVKGVGINNDGGDKGSFTAPSVEGQANSITRALHDAQISPSTISYIEAHGTANSIR